MGSAGNIKIITPKASEPPSEDNKGKIWAELKGGICLGKETLLLSNS